MDKRNSKATLNFNVRHIFCFLFILDITLSINRLKGTFGTVDIYYRTLDPEELHPQVPVTVNRAGVNDYRATEGMVRFGPTEPQKTIIVTVMDDSDPENDESFYVILINATLHTPAQTRTGIKLIKKMLLTNIFNSDSL